MSQYPYEKIMEDREKARIDKNIVRIIRFSLVVTPLLETLPMMNTNVLETLEDQSQVLAQKELREIRRMQKSDSLIERWRVSVIDQAVQQTHPAKADLTMKKQFKNLFMKHGILFRKVLDGDEKIQQLVLPECYHQEVRRGFHDDMGHPGVEDNGIDRERFYRPGMYLDVENWVKRVPLISVNTTYPLELVCLDFLTQEPSREVGNVHTDHYTKYALAIPTNN